VIGHGSFRTLAGLYVLARIAVDLIGAMFLFYFTYWLGREADFAPTMALFLLTVVLCLPAWLHFARKRDKRVIFIFGAAWWIGAQFFTFAADPSWPRWTVFTIVALAAIGYAVADLMPWSMLGDVIDEDELASGRRREGVFVGVFTFLRKLGGATAVFLVGIVLDLAGYQGGGAAPDAQSPLAVDAIRWLTSIAPAVFLGLAIWVALHYRLSRAAHARVLRQLHHRDPSR
jgi:Na+/melibiose symporter-like transporter